MEKKKILFVITQFFKGGAEVALLNLLKSLSPAQYEVDFLIFDQIELQTAVSLIPQIPPWVNVCNAAQDEGTIALAKKVFFKVYRKLTKRQLYRQSAYQFVKGKQYDIAFSYGEWMAPEFVATKVSAQRKAVWIHTDIDKARYVDDKVLFGWDFAYQHYIFVSERSKQSAESKYPFLRGRSCVIHNMCDDKKIQELSKEPLQLDIGDKPVLLTVANIRTEKNHLRQIEAMHLLKQKGICFKWLNVGCAADPFLYNKVCSAINSYGLQDDFLLLGADENPYKYMKNAKAVCVLSDYESWSIVITEAKLLGVPVLATKTSGALEQLTDGHTGILCDFNAEDIAEKIRIFLTDEKLSNRIRMNLRGFTTEQVTLQEFEQFVQNFPSAIEENKNTTQRRKRLLYIFDDINYLSGAQKATAEQIKCLANFYNIDIFSLIEPLFSAKELFKSANTIFSPKLRNLQKLHIPFFTVMRSPSFSLRQKLDKFAFAILNRIGLSEWFVEKLIKREFYVLFNSYDTVCVVSEASKLRRLVASLRHPRKVQWIHTDYALWSRFSSWTKGITKNDGSLYERFDIIVCLSEYSRRGFLECFPSLNRKTTVIRNLIAVDEIIEKSKKTSSVNIGKDEYSFITVGRLEEEKRFDRILRVCAALKGRGLRFRWYIVGEGSLYNELEREIKRLCLSDRVVLTGRLENPYPLMCQCNLFALLSDYEGLPVTIDEALVLGLPVLATAVGGIPEQLRGGEWGMLVEPDENSIMNTLAELITYKHDDIRKCDTWEIIENNNEDVLRKLREIF